MSFEQTTNEIHRYALQRSTRHQQGCTHSQLTVAQVADATQFTTSGALCNIILQFRPICILLQIGYHLADTKMTNYLQGVGFSYQINSIISLWDDNKKVRKMMKDGGVRKEPGCSWIEVNKQVHSFFVGDRSHPQMQQIYEKLEILSQQMKAVSYAPTRDQS